ncbi:MAG: VWA domain-containing protein [Deltaproteobacteria bacterium]|jgi:Ca-activated chloride channel family protein|nr:VWA domain-containing protein [Deltaproteobacteria bacterium]
MKKLIRFIIFILFLGTVPGTSLAAGMLTPTGSGHQPIRIRDHHVNVVINNGFAMTEVLQTFYNPNQQDLEAVYSLPLPKSASLSEVTIYVGEREINGEVLEKQKAQQLYEDEKSRGNEAGLAEKNEFYTFDFRIQPVPANDETKIRFLYYQPLNIDTGVGRYLYPLEDGGTDDAGMSFWTTNAKVDNTFSVNLELKSAYPVQDVRIPGFEAAAQINQLAEDHYRVEMQLTDMSLSRDFIFYYRLQDGLPGSVEVIPFRDSPSEPGTFMMVITPGIDLKPLTNGVDYCFVMDVSGSMQSKMGTFKQGVIKAIEKLKPEDRFRLVTFSSSASELTRKWLPASDANRIKAQTMIDSLQAGGSTNLYAGLSLALKDLDDDRAANIILVTDAVTNTGVVDPVEFHKLLQQVDVRVFGFLLGNSANWPLMQTIAATTGGFYDSMSNADDIMGKLMQAGGKINYEALLDAEVKISGVSVSDITDDTFKKIYRGQQLVLFGKYAKGGKTRVTLKANLTGEDKTYTTDFVFPDTDTDNPELERLWALAMIEKIEALERIGTMPVTESENAIRDLGLEYQIVTDFTSMVVLSDTTFADHGIERRNQSRIAREQQARSRKAQQPVKNYTVDHQKPAFKFKTPSLGGGGGAIDPLTGGLAAVLTILGAVRLAIRNKKKR